MLILDHHEVSWSGKGHFHMFDQLLDFFLSWKILGICKTKGRENKRVEVEMEGFFSETKTNNYPPWN